MNKLKKVISITISLILLLGLFSACGTSNDINESTTSVTKQTQSNTSQSSTSQATSAPEETVVINWMPQNDGPTDTDSPVIMAIQEKFNVKFEFIYLDRSQEEELLNVKLASGEIPDVFQASTDQRFRFLLDQGVLGSVKESTIQTIAPTFYSLTTNDGIEGIWNFCRGSDGDIYGIPMLNPAGKYPYVPIWRDDWLKNVGIDKIPETLAEAETAFYKFVNEDPDKNDKKDTYALSNKGMEVVFGAFGGLPPFFDKMTIKWVLVDGKPNAGITTPDMKEAVTLLNKWYEDGLIDPEYITGENKGEYWGNSLVFWNGKIGFSMPGMYYHIIPPNPEGTGASANYTEFKNLQGESATFATGTPLVGPSGKAGTQMWGTFSGAYTVFGKNIDDKKIEKVLKIMEAGMTDWDTFLLIQRGIKGLTYDVTQSGDIVNLLKTPVEFSKYGIDTNGVGKNMTNSFEFTKKLDRIRFEYADKVANFPEKGLRNVVWVSLPSFQEHKADVEKMAIENYTYFITGKRDIAEWDKFIEEINKVGLEKMTKEAEEWYAKYN